LETPRLADAAPVVPADPSQEITDVAATSSAVEPLLADEMHDPGASAPEATPPGRSRRRGRIALALAVVAALATVAALGFAYVDLKGSYASLERDHRHLQADKRDLQVDKRELEKKEADARAEADRSHRRIDVLEGSCRRSSPMTC
jgi:hypothetical protein